MIAGMGETHAELVEMAKTFRRFRAQSIPVNFLLPFEGNVLNQPQGLSPEFCLRVLCMFRFVNPDAEIRCAAGREFHLRSMEVMCLYAANSIFLDGYLNGRGAERRRTYQMLRDAGFEIESEHGGVDDLLDEIAADDAAPVAKPVEMTIQGQRRPTIKSLDELHPVSV